MCLVCYNNSIPSAKLRKKNGLHKIISKKTKKNYFKKKFSLIKWLAERTPLLPSRTTISSLSFYYMTFLTQWARQTYPFIGDILIFNTIQSTRRRGFCFARSRGRLFLFWFKSCRGVIASRRVFLSRLSSLTSLTPLTSHISSSQHVPVAQSPQPSVSIRR